MLEKIALTQTQTKLLTELAQASTSPQGIVLRAKLLLDYVSGGK